jgi:acyl carrier protein
MVDNEIYEKVKKIIIDLLGSDEEKITPEARFREDLEADSLDLVELIMAFEDEFGGEISDEEAQITTVGQAVEYLQSSFIILTQIIDQRKGAVDPCLFVALVIAVWRGSRKQMSKLRITLVGFIMIFGILISACSGGNEQGEVINTPNSESQELDQGESSGEVGVQSQSGEGSVEETSVEGSAEQSITRGENPEDLPIMDGA